MLFSIGAIGVGTYFLYNAITSMDKPLPPTAERSSSNAASAVTTYNKEEQMVSTVFGKGPANLTELRKQTTERRKKVSRILSKSFQFASRSAFSRWPRSTPRRSTSVRSRSRRRTGGRRRRRSPKRPRQSSRDFLRHTHFYSCRAVRSKN